MDEIQRLAARCAEARAAAIERAVERALVTGRCGVLVNDVRCFATPHPSVPYGQIHILSSFGEGDPMGWLHRDVAA